MSDWNDPEATACNGPTLNELREASIDRMLEPYRQRLHEINEAVLRDVTRAIDIVRDLADSDPSFGESGCGFCGLSRGTPGWPKPESHETDCEWRRAVEWVRDQEMKT